MSKHLTYQRAHELFEYEPASGLLTRRVSTNYNAQVGDVVGTDGGHGYLRVNVGGKNHLVHRLVFLLMSGKWPEAGIDHINGVRSDNRWENLREATKLQNGRNLKMKSNNTSGFKGVKWHKKAGRWMASIQNNGVQYYLGLFDKPEEAAQAYVSAAAILFGQWQRGELK